MRLKNEHVHQRSLAMVQVPHNRHIARHRRELEHTQHEAGSMILISLSLLIVWRYSNETSSPLVIPRLRHVFLLHNPLPHFNRRHDRFCEGLRVFFLDQSLDVGAIDLFCSWVVLLVLM